jgi:hypothetical protein
MNTSDTELRAAWQSPILVDLTTRQTQSGESSEAERTGGTSVEPIFYGPTPGGS